MDEQKQVLEFRNEIFKSDFDNLSDLNIRTLEATCKYIGLEFNYELYSELNLPEKKEKHLNNNIDLQFLLFHFHEYDQKRKDFIPGQAVLDAMTFLTPSEINQILDEYHLIK